LQWEFKLNSAAGVIVEHWLLKGHVLNVSMHITSHQCCNFICMYKTVNKNHHACVIWGGGGGGGAFVLKPTLGGGGVFYQCGSFCWF